MGNEKALAAFNVWLNGNLNPEIDFALGVNLGLHADTIRAALTASGGWQDISTIPDDGSVVIIYSPNAQWSVTTYKTQKGFSPACTGATHFMLLPKPPTEKGE